MFPSLRQRLVITAAALCGALAWLAVFSAVKSPDGTSGLTLLDHGVSHALFATLLIALAGIPAMVLGLVASSSGNPMSGFFAVAVALCVLAGRGGSAAGFIERSAAADNLPGAYVMLMVECLVWQLGVVVMIFAVAKLRSPIKTRLPALAFSDHLGVDTRLHWPALQSLAAGGVTAAVACAVAWAVIRSPDQAQVLWGLVIAFTLGAVVAQSVFPRNRNPVGVLFAPVVCAMFSYTMVLMSYRSTNEFLRAFFRVALAQAGDDRVFSPALALPAHYISAGIVGCTLGIGLAQVMVAKGPLQVSHGTA